jgi:hypothetical protein
MEQTDVKSIRADDKDGQQSYIRKVQEAMAKMDPAKVHCMMFIGVEHSPTPEDPNNARVECQIIGTDADVAKMLSTLIQTARSGVLHTHMPSHGPNETAH